MLTSPFKDGVVPRPKDRVPHDTFFKERQNDMEGELFQAPGMPDLGNLQLSERLRLKCLRGDLTPGQTGGYLAIVLPAFNLA
jgi:hypothetical protein